MNIGCYKSKGQLLLNSVTTEHVRGLSGEAVKFVVIPKNDGCKDRQVDYH